MQACTKWTHSDIWWQLATMLVCLFEIRDQQSEKKGWNVDRRAICNARCSFDARRGVIRHRGGSDGSDRAHPLWPSHSARTEMYFANGERKVDQTLDWNKGHRGNNASSRCRGSSSARAGWSKESWKHWFDKHRFRNDFLGHDGYHRWQSH